MAKIRKILMTVSFCISHFYAVVGLYLASFHRRNATGKTHFIEIAQQLNHCRDVKLRRWSFEQHCKRSKPTFLRSRRHSNGVFTRSSQRPANFQQMYSKYTC